MSKKRNNKESMIWLASKPNQTKTISEIIGVSLWPQSSPDLKPLDYAIWSILENKTNTTFHPNIVLFKTAFREGWNKMSKVFILKAGKLL